MLKDILPTLPTATSLKHSLRHSHNQPKTSATRFCPEKGGVLRTSESNDQLIRKKAGFHGQTLPHKAIIIRNNRATVARWLGADLPPSVLEGGAREAGGPGPPRVIPRRDVVNKTQLHPVGSFAERHPANSPHGDFSQTFTPTFPQPTENISNSILSGERGRFTDK